MPLPIKLQDLLKRGVSTQAAAAPPAMAPLRGWWPAWLLLAYGVLVIARAPVILFEGRFWAEEGKVFFQHACRSGWLSALVSADSTHGYFSLLNNLAALLASRLVSLEHATLELHGSPLVRGAGQGTREPAIPAPPVARRLASAPTAHRQLRTIASRWAAVILRVGKGPQVAAISSTRAPLLSPYVGRC